MREFWSFFAFGLSFGCGPCLVSCGPLFLAYLAGGRKNTKDSLLDYFIFSAARISVYLFFTVLIFLLGRIITQSVFAGGSKAVLAIGGVFVVLLGFLTVSDLKPGEHFCGKFCARFIGGKAKNVAILGLITGLLPCAPLIALFSYAGLAAGSLSRSFLYTLVFGLGTFFSPLLVFSFAAGFIPRMMNRGSKRLNRIFSVICGLIIIYLGAELLRRIWG
jgi:sulfite exporter TauE/SafE